MTNLKINIVVFAIIPVVVVVVLSATAVILVIIVVDTVIPRKPVLITHMLTFGDHIRKHGSGGGLIDRFVFIETFPHVPVEIVDPLREALCSCNDFFICVSMPEAP